MTGYIYHIINKTTQKHYIGMTTNIDQRLYKHFHTLEKNRHVNKKLQEDYNLYGRADFYYTIQQYEVKSRFELGQLEVQEINQYDSVKNGYNIDTGGQLGSQSNINFLTEDQIMMLLAQQYDNGNHNLLVFAKICGSHSDSIQKLFSRLTFLPLRDKFENLPEEEKQWWVQQSREYFQIDLQFFSNAWLTKRDCCGLLAMNEFSGYYGTEICSCVGLGSESPLRSLLAGNTYKDYKAYYDSLPLEARKQYYAEINKQFDFESFHKIYMKGKKNGVCHFTKNQVFYILDQVLNKKRTRVSVGEELGEDPRLIGHICAGRRYKDYYKEFMEQNVRHE